ncbi:MAG: NADP-specific glutamate dehydrogenase [Rhizobiales bacterium]|nr:NADP-specific glutamate dehydrogenase [Hyphomicrobiales bacterium]MBO6698617.1 NADP-specific glutamate dehydrogenase [Hyphomicrobiales bacterium]MBO6735130.1 NADP-specific glutamate dehydrogenase [Hyphomicrobiales bacterium]MBO6911063.1 NADP-specific glutamate dehydrogenase [Hyphomicrobiales bacterium]MBO6956426.1 NADP-specific glutamate dehydrogenase [Hyphomicrobiales bacterium]
MTARQALVDDFMERVTARNEGQNAFLQAVEEVAGDVLTVEKAHSDFAKARVLERLSEPDRIIAFRVVWEDDEGEVQINRGWRVQTSNAIGPYKGGIRFHPTVSPSILKFLGFEQVFKNALTGLPLGGGKGGADLDPRGRSEREIMRFCQAFMAELAHHIGPDRDVPAGDINVGTREIGYLFGAYKRHFGQFHGALTGKGQSFGGSAMRVQATGFGLIYFVQTMLHAHDDSIDGKRVAISGKGNVATHAAQKAIEVGAKVITLSDTSGTLLAENGLSQEAVDWVRAQKAAGGDVSDPPKPLGLTFKEGALPWGEEADIVLPCATQNEMDAQGAEAALDAGAKVIAEGANMPLTAGAAAKVDAADVLYAPGKAANAGGVAISGLEMSQDAHRRFSTAEEVDEDLKMIMRRIHDTIADEGRSDGKINYRRGANVAGYRRVARALTAYGVV